MEYVFIVGLPRTGTKLVRNVIENAHGVHARISPETWFFGDYFRSGLRKKIKQFGDMKNDESVRRLIDYLFSGSFSRSYWNFIRKTDVQARKSQFERAILGSDRTEKEIYKTILKIYADIDAPAESGLRQIVGDKTPGHLYHVPIILSWFPDARIIHTFRDPRAIMASELKKVVENEAASRRPGYLSKLIRMFAVVVFVTVTWRKAAKLHARYSREYPEQYFLSRYEDLVAMPQESVARLCDFLGLSPSSEMLDPPHRDSSYDDARGGHGFDVRGLERWRTYLKPWVQRWLWLSTGRYWATFGYMR